MRGRGMRFISQFGNWQLAIGIFPSLPFHRRIFNIVSYR
jgi:hypothetical protein